MRIASFLKTTTFRLALLYAGLFCASFIALFAVVYWSADALATADRRTLVYTDIQGLADAYKQGGVDGLKEAINERIQPVNVSEGIYVLVDAHYNWVAGNITAWPTNAQPTDGWIRFPIGMKIVQRTEGPKIEEHIIEAYVSDLPSGHRVLIGRDTHTQQQFQKAISRAFLIWLAGIIGLAVIGGLIMSRSILRRIEAINQAAERIMQGEVKHRMPVRGRNDEFDRLAENLNAMLEEIDRLLGSIRAVTNNIAHDLRSPLNRLRNRLEAALADKQPEQRQEAIERAIGDADELLSTFNALLSIADAEAGTSRGNLMPVDLVALAHDVAELYEPLVEEQGLVLEKSIAGPAPVSGNRQLLFQAIGNLIDNATKYGATGGRVSLNVMPGRNGSGPEIAVADKGPGIPATERGRVLERFVRLDASRSTPGNGLGLSLVAAIARLHNAVLNLDDNQPGLKVTLRFKPVAA